MRKILAAGLLIAAVLGLGSAWAGDATLDFDGQKSVNNLQGRSVVFQGGKGEEVPVPVKTADDGTVQKESAFWDNAKCINKSCKKENYGWSCNLETCGKVLSTPEQAEDPKPIGDLLTGLSADQLNKFYDSLSYREGIFVGAYMKDVEDVLGKDKKNEIIRRLLPDSGELKGDDYDPNDYKNDYFCHSASNCMKKAGYVCPKSC